MPIELATHLEVCGVSLLLLAAVIGLAIGRGRAGCHVISVGGH